MIYYSKKNNAYGFVADNPLSASAVSINLASGEGARFPASYFVISVWDANTYADPSLDPDSEIMLCDTRVGDVLNVTRAQEGTTAKQHPVGSKVIMAITAGVLTQIEGSVIAGSGDVTGPAGAITNHIPQFADVSGKTIKDGLAIATSVGTPGVDTAVVTEKAVRDALGALPGGGDVVGPAGATDENIAVFNLATGKIIKDGGSKISDLLPKSTYDANSILYATTDNTPVALTVGTNTVVGRVGGAITTLAIDNDISTTSANDDTVPSAKAVKTAVDAKADKLITAGNVGSSTDLATAVANIDDSQTSENDSGFGAWTSGADASTYTITGGKFQLDRSGYGYINGKKISFNSGLQTGVLAANDTYFVYIDTDGSIQTSTSYVPQKIMLFEVLYDGTNYFVVRENHPFNFDSQVSGFLHNSVGTIIGGTGGNVTRVATGTGGAAGDREIKIVGAATLYDHGLSTTIPDSAGAGVTWNVYYKNAGGKWVRNVQQSQLPMSYNNAGTVTALGTGPNTDTGIYVLYVSKDDIESSAPTYFAVMNNAVFDTVALAQAAITAGTIQFADNELSRLELAQLGYAIVENNGTSGYINTLTIAKSTLNQQLVGGAAATSHSSLSNLDFASAGHTGFAPATSGSAILKGNGTGGFSNASAGTDYAPATSGTSILKGNGSGGFSNASSGTDYAPATSGSSILKGNGSGGFSNATAGDADSLVSAASTTTAGKVELATTAEIDTGTDTTRAMPVDQFVASTRNVRIINIRLVEKATDVAAATTVGGDFECPITGTITAVGAYVDTAGTTNLTTIDINKGGSTIMTTNKITIDSTEKTSRTAATAPTLTTTAISAGDILTFDVDGVSTTAPKGLTVRVEIRLT